MSSALTRRRLLQLGAQAAAAVSAARLLPLPSLAALQDEGAARAAITRFTERHLAEMHAPGLTLGLATRDAVLEPLTFGFADVKLRQPVAPRHLFQIGSISKSFVAIAAVQLHEEGKLDLERPVREYLPWLRIRSDYAPITAHHLLTHTSGLPGNFLSGLGWEFWTAHAPGEHYHYNNRGYAILGRLLETLDGRPFPEVIQRRVLQPLGMKDSLPSIVNDARARMPVSYIPRHSDRPHPRGGPLIEAPVIVMENPAGSVLSTPHDMGLYMHALLNRGRGQHGRILSENGFELFTRPVIPAPAFGPEGQYAYGIAVTKNEGRTVLRHTGGMVSFSSAMHVDMDAGLAAFASANAGLQGYRPNAVAAYALGALRAAAAAGAPLSEPPQPDDVERADNAADYAGVFTAPDGRKLALEAEGERLFLVHDGRRIPTQRRGSDNFLALDPAWALFALQFTREEGVVTEAAYGGDWYVNERYHGPRDFEYPKEWEAFAGHYVNDNPWFGSLRVVLRKGRLLLGGSTPLAPLGEGTFRVGEPEHNTERIRFHTVSNGKALYATLSGTEFERSWAR